MEKLYETFDKFVHSDWLTTVLGVVIILGVTLILSRAAVAITRKLLKKGSLLPTSSIFVNVIRVAIWLVGLSFMLSTCFSVNVSAVIAGLGVVGIAVSLGFQDTISNLIGGLQISVSRTVEPGDNIQMGVSGVSGVVRDVTWRYTTIDNLSTGYHIVVPNSLMTTTAVTRLSPPENVSIPIVVTDSEQRLTSVAHHMEEAAQKALARVGRIKKGPSVTFSEITDRGFKGTLSFTLSDKTKISAAKDAAIRAVAPYAHQEPLEQMAGTMEQQYLMNSGMAKAEAMATVDADKSTLEIVPTADAEVANQAQPVAQAEQRRVAAVAGAAPVTGPDPATESVPAAEPASTAGSAPAVESASATGSVAATDLAPATDSSASPSSNQTPKE